MVPKPQKTKDYIAEDSTNYIINNWTDSTLTGTPLSYDTIDTVSDRYSLDRAGERISYYTDSSSALTSSSYTYQGIDTSSTSVTSIPVRVEVSPNCYLDTPNCYIDTQLPTFAEYDAAGRVMAHGFYNALQSKTALFQKKLRNQLDMCIVQRGNYRADFSNVQPNEIKALTLMKKMVPVKDFRKYLKDGTIVVKGPSGLRYTIKRKNHLIDVWHLGKRLATLCVYVKMNVPPTDDVIAKMVIAECDEPDIWRRANVSWRDVQSTMRSMNTKNMEHHHLVRLVA